MMIGSFGNDHDKKKETLFAQLFAFFNVGEVRNSRIGVRGAELNT